MLISFCRMKSQNWMPKDGMIFFKNFSRCTDYCISTKSKHEI